jgi:octaheme c-type cytochrome (tetrathionate reductase family)
MSRLRSRSPKAALSLLPCLLGLGLLACDGDGNADGVTGGTSAGGSGSGGQLGPDAGTGGDVVGLCTPACDVTACQSCDATGTTPACVTFCGEGTTCQNGTCVAEPVVEPATCAPACDACQRCDTTGETPVCVDNCGDGLVCENGTCVAPVVPPPATCEPACDACQRCDTTGESPVCVDNCGDGLVCENGTCVAPVVPPPATCEPACDACQRCDTTGESPVCVNNCGDGLVCESGTCVAPVVPPPATCEPACGACQRCDTTGESPVCVDNCAAGLVCENGLCVAPVVPPPATCEPACGACQICDTTGAAPVCIDACGQDELCMSGACRPVGMHANFDVLAGPFADGPAVTTQCLECHPNEGHDFLQTAHWKWAGPTPNLQGHEAETTQGKRTLINNFCIATDSNEARCTQCHAGYGWRDSSFDFNDAGKVDCLVCHADGASGYAKAPTTAGAPVPTADLALAARSVGRPTRDNCGACHFYAGGGDNVKKGDLGSALKNATIEMDVHLGRGMECADCHATENHRVLGQGAHIGVSEGRLDCTDCHGTAPHGNPLTDNHAQDLACQTCHVPAFSRAQPTKMNWDWSTAGNRTRGNNGVEQSTLPDGTVYTSYDAMKGDFVWEKGVRPEYAWYDGRVRRMMTDDVFPAGAGTEENPVVLGTPLADHADADAKIWPFKVMRGRQAIDPARRLVLVPKLFGPGGFWGAIPAAAAYTPEAVRALWTSALTAGARVAGQIGPAESYADDTWAWGFTEMWMGIEHEVAPPAAALGCQDCHGNPAFDFVGLGYACDPMMGVNCGTRH